MRLQDKTAIVTGGGQGIGRGIARMFAQEGARVVIAARTAERLEGVRTEIEAEGGDVLAVPTDVGKLEDMQALIQATRERFGGLDILVNNAGVGHGSAIDETDMKDYDRVMDTNLKGMYLGCHLGVPLMKKAGQGSIINISSVHGVEGSPGHTVYAATKGGIIGCTRSLAAELAPFLIRVNTISPGAIHLGGGTAGWLKRIKPEHHDEFLERFGNPGEEGSRTFQPLEVLGQPVDIAYCAVYLASNESRFVTGQNLVVDGGLTSYLAESPRDDLREKYETHRRELREWMETHRIEESD